MKQAIWSAVIAMLQTLAVVGVILEGGNPAKAALASIVVVIILKIVFVIVSDLGYGTDEAREAFALSLILAALAGIAALVAAGVRAHPTAMDVTVPLSFPWAFYVFRLMCEERRGEKEA